MAHASELAKSASTRRVGLAPYAKMSQFPIWDEIKSQVQDPKNYVSGKGVDHYNRFREDFDIAKGLNLNAFRFGIEWSRIEPKEGVWDEKEIEHYHTYIKELKKRGIEPFLNIWHWTMPTWFTDKGGFSKQANLKHWQAFVQKFADEYGHMLNYVLTINEPNVYMGNSYIQGKWPPQDQNVLRGLHVYWSLAKAHKQAYKILKTANPKLKVGVATSFGTVKAQRPNNLIDITTAWASEYFWNWWYLRRIRKYQDFVGFNYYQTRYVKGIKDVTPKAPVNDLGWYMEPEGLFPLMVKAWRKFKKPIFITENGVADMHDQYRQWWIEETMVAMERAISEGVDVQGYLHWSLLDNFEWAYGWWPKFGLVEVDRAHGMKRAVRPSAKWWAEKIKEL